MAESDNAAKGVPLRVCMLMRLFCPVYSGAAEQAKRLVCALRKLGIEAFILTVRFPGLSAREVVEGVQVYRLPQRAETYWGRLLFALDTVRFLVANRDQYDILHLHGVSRWFSYAAIVSGKILQKPVVVKLTLSGSNDPFTIRRQSFGYAKNAILALADRTVCLNQEMYRQCLASGYHPARLLRIPNGVDILKFSPATRGEREHIRRALDLPSDGLIAVFVGILARRKGVDVLLDAWRDISRRYPQALLLLLGPTHDPNNPFDDDVTHSLKQRIAACAPGTVVAPGHVADVSQLLRAADVFVFPSRAEGLPNALLEAMACGLPSVASRISGVTDVACDDVEALLVEAEDVPQLVQALGRLLDDKDLRVQMGRAARARVEAEFSLQTVAARYAAEYREMVRR